MPCLPIAVIQCPLPVRTYFRNYPPGEGHGRGGASLLVARHFLAPARSLTGLDGVLEVFRRLGSIQFDPVAVAGRNHDLVLHARVAGYEPSWGGLLYPP